MESPVSPTVKHRDSGRKRSDNDSRGWNSQYTNPIYFGYSSQSVTDFNRQLLSEKAELKTRENRAIERARATRMVAIDALERSTVAQAKARVEKIEKLEAKYEANKLKREVELERNERELQPTAFAVYEVSLAYDAAYHFSAFYMQIMST